MPYILLLATLGVFLAGICSTRLNPFSTTTTGPESPFSTFGPKSPELQGVCTAHGRLQLLAKYPSDSMTAFEFLGLDPDARPFYPHHASRRDGDRWHRELQELVDNEYTRRLDRVNRVDAHGRGGTDIAQYKLTLAAVTDVLEKGSPRRFYVETVLPMLERVRRDQPARCVWPRIREFNWKLCAATWRVTGLLDDLVKVEEMVFADDGCSNLTKSPGWSWWWSFGR
ncbi:hypothetical protein F5144DRAFT_602969 [Chaetomium tenue]|uniref:Uncharacterized protein n=1 Tax=Chaetomium tenue TaxID=1854479 RepID=A0ACB7P9T8_9PEZI|nr:hypothetical protein F5144DRAFT_602969 [Chaetomium globosum]